MNIYKPILNADSGRVGVDSGWVGVDSGGIGFIKTDVGDEIHINDWIRVGVDVNKYLQTHIDHRLKLGWGRLRLGLKSY